MTATHTSTTTCIHCAGTGFVSEEKIGDCRLCSATGILGGVPCFNCNGECFENQSAWTLCPACGGNTVPSR